MNAPETSRFNNWLGAMVALLIAVALTWFWRFYTPGSASLGEMQAEEDMVTTAAAAPEFIIADDGIDQETGLEDATIRQRLNVDLNLGELYTAQKIYRGENGHYTTDLVGAGWRPQNALMGYKIGFLEASVPMSIDEIPTRQSSDDYLTVNELSTDAPYVYDPAAQLINLSRYARLCREGCTAYADGFEIMIAIPLDNQGRADIWLLNDRKELTHVWDGISNQQLQ